MERGANRRGYFAIVKSSVMKIAMTITPKMMNWMLPESSSPASI